MININRIRTYSWMFPEIIELCDEVEDLRSKVNKYKTLVGDTNGPIEMCDWALKMRDLEYELSLTKEQLSMYQDEELNLTPARMEELRVLADRLHKICEEV